MSIKNLLLVSFTFIIASCGGGGGGDGSSSSGSAATGVRVLHATIDAGPIDIYSSFVVGNVITSGYFVENTFYGNLSQGEQILTLTLHNTPTLPIADLDITVEKNKHYSLLYYGNRDQLGLRTALISDDPGEIPDGMAAIKIVHGLVGASMINATISDGQNIKNTDFGTASTYVYITPGIKNVTIKRTTDGRTVATLNATFASGTAYTVLLAGEIDYFVASRLLED